MAAAAARGFPAPVFFHQASVEAGQRFFAERAPHVTVIADPDGVFYDAFDIRRGRLWDVWGPGVWLRGVRALTKGHWIGAPCGDVMRMPGLVLVGGQRVLWRHRARHAGDHTDLEDVQRALEVSVLAARRRDIEHRRGYSQSSTARRAP